MELAAAKKPTDKDRIKTATHALMDLNAFYAIIAICEGGCFHAPSRAATQRIINICRAESSKRLRDHDRAMAAIGRDTHGNMQP